MADPALRPISKDERAAPDAVERIQAIINAEPEPSPSKRLPPAALQGEQAPEQTPVQEEANPEAEAPAGPNKQVEGEESPAEDAQRGAEIPLDQLEAIELEVTFKGEDGKDVTEKQTIKELRLGAMRQRDYQRKTAEVARQRDAVGEQVRQAVESERSQYQTSLQQMHALLLETAAPELKNVNWDDLATNNAFEYVRLSNLAKKHTQALSTIQAKHAEVTTKMQAEQATAKKQQAAKAVAELEADIPGWNDALYQTLMKSSAKFGYKPEEVSTWADARAFKVLHKAHLYDQLQAENKTPDPNKKVVVPPKVIRPGPAQNVSQGQQQAQSAMKRLQTSGKISDAADVIRSRLG